MSAIALTRQTPKVGDTLAKQGAWNRRYIVRYIIPSESDETEDRGIGYVVIGIQFIGNYYATGKVILPKHASPVVEKLNTYRIDNEYYYMSGFIVCHDNAHIIPATYNAEV